MKYITFDRDETRTYKADYNTTNYTEEELIDICNAWNEEENEADKYFIYEIPEC